MKAGTTPFVHLMAPFPAAVRAAPTAYRDGVNGTWLERGSPKFEKEEWDVSSRNRQTRLAALGAATVASTLAATAVVGVAHGRTTADDDLRASPTTSVEPYVLPVAPGVRIDSHFTVDDETAQDGYRMVGIPDGLGAFRSGTGNVVTYLNHELSAGQGIVRRHGQDGAFVSRLVIDPVTGAVERGRDLIKVVNYWDYQSGGYVDAPVAPAGAAEGHQAAFSRFCSGYLAPRGSLLNEASGRGFQGSLYFANEEAGVEGRAFGVSYNGAAFQLPLLGLFSWENTVSAANQTDTTVVMGNEDDAAGQLRVYVGRKQDTGTKVDKAGLTNGRLFVVDAVNEAVSTDAQFREAFGKGNSAAVRFGAGEEIDSTQSGNEQNVEAAAKGLALNRIEDGSFDPNNKNNYYFLTTEGGSTAPNPKEPTIARDGGGLWKLHFTDVERPELGGRLTLLLDGSERPYLSKPDNMTIDDEGNMLIQEDPGTSDHLARIVAYNLRNGNRGVVARFDRGLFGASNPSGVTGDDRAVLTTNEESSGIINTDDLFGDDTFMFDAQAHTAKGLPAGTGPGTVQEYVERGQLMTMQIDNWRAVYRIRDGDTVSR